MFIEDFFSLLDGSFPTTWADEGGAGRGGAAVGKRADHKKHEKMGLGPQLSLPFWRPGRPEQWLQQKTRQQRSPEDKKARLVKGGRPLWLA